MKRLPPRSRSFVPRPVHGDTRWNRANAIALGLSSLVIGTVAATVQPTPTSPVTPNGGGRRPTPPSLARHAFAARDNVQVRSAPSPAAQVEGTFGLGSGFRIGPEAIPGWFPIVREWVNEDGSRTTRDLAFVSAADITFTDPRRVAFQRATTTTGQAVKPGRSDGGECDLFVSVNWPSNVDDFKRRLDTVASATDRSIRDCPALLRAQQDEWAVFFAQWREFAARPTPTFGSGREWDTVCAYARTLDGWRETLSSTSCVIVGPTNIHGYEVAPGVENSLASIAGIVKWGTLALGGIVLFGTFYPEIREATAALRARRSSRRA